MRDLEFALFKQNNLMGSLPSTWSELQKLRVIDVTSNVHLSGTLPPSWSAMQSLLWLDAADTGFYGLIPDEWNHGMVSIERIDLRNQHRTSMHIDPICVDSAASDTRLASGVALLDGC